MNDPFTPPPGGFGLRVRPATTPCPSRTAAASPSRIPRTPPRARHRPARPVRPRLPGRASASDPAAEASASTHAEASASAAVRAAVAAGADAASAATSEPPSWFCWPTVSMHGYEMIQEISDRSGGLWRPSPGSVYPTLQLLVDEGLIVGTESEGSKRLFELTEEGRTAAEKVETPPWDEIAEGVDPGQVNLHTALRPVGGCGGAVRLHRVRGAAAAHRRHRQRRPPRGVQHPRRIRVVRIRPGISPAGHGVRIEYANLPAGLFPCRPRRLRRHATSRPRCVRTAARPGSGAGSAAPGHRTGHQPHRHRAVLRARRLQRTHPRGPAPLSIRPGAGHQGRRRTRRRRRVDTRPGTRPAAREPGREPSDARHRQARRSQPAGVRQRGATPTRPPGSTANCSTVSSAR